MLGPGGHPEPACARKAIQDAAGRRRRPTWHRSCLRRLQPGALILLDEDVGVIGVTEKADTQPSDLDGLLAFLQGVPLHNGAAVWTGWVHVIRPGVRGDAIADDGGRAGLEVLANDHAGVLRCVVHEPNICRSSPITICERAESTLDENEMPRVEA